MNIVKMSPLTVLLAQKRKRRNEEKKKLTLLPSPALLRALGFFSFFSHIAHTWKRREKQKHYYTEHRPMMHSSNQCAPRVFFCYVFKRTSLHTLFSYFFCARRLYSAAKTKESATSFSFSLPSLSLILTYIRNKSHLDFF